MRILVVILLLLLIAFGAFGQLPDVGYMGLFLHGPTHNPVYSCAWYGIEYYEYTVKVYVMCLPSVNGTATVLFAINRGGAHSGTFFEVNPDVVSIQMGDIENGFTACLYECQYDWFWVGYTNVEYSTTRPPTWVELVPHSSYSQFDTPLYVNCDHQDEPTIVYARVGLNRECPPDEPLATKETSWGAVKSLYQ